MRARFLTSLKNQKGFSLVELMVVVAIIGILAAIGIPSMQKYMAKARQSEAKTTLSSLYTTEKAFFAEYNIYTGDFGALGFQPEGQLRYEAGFAGAGTLTPSSYGYTGSTTGLFTVSTVCDAPGTGVGARTRPCIMTAESLSADITDATNPTQGTFIAAASALIYTGNGNTQADVWLIDQDKNLRQPATKNGIP